MDFVLYTAPVVLLMIGVWLFLRGKPPDFRRKWHRRLTWINAVFWGLIFVGLPVLFPFRRGFQEEGLDDLAGWLALLFWVGLFGGALAFITYVNLKTKTCPVCGNFVSPQNVFWPRTPQFCPRCGASFSVEEDQESN